MQFSTTVILLCLVRFVAGSEQTFSVLLNHRLDSVFVFEVKAAVCGPHSCAALCQSSPKCLSVSVHKESGECHLSSVSLSAKTGAPIPDSAWDYYYIPGEENNITMNTNCLLSNSVPFSHEAGVKEDQEVKYNVSVPVTILRQCHVKRSTRIKSKSHQRNFKYAVNMPPPPPSLSASQMPGSWH